MSIENWQESYKQHQIQANQILEKAIAQKTLEDGLGAWDDDEKQLLSKGQLAHIRLWLNIDELSDEEKQFIAASNAAISEQTHPSTPALENNDFFTGLIMTNVFMLIVVAAVIASFFIFKVDLFGSKPNQTQIAEIAKLEQQIKHLRKDNAAISSAKKQELGEAKQQIEQLEIQKQDYYAKWVLQAVESYVAQDKYQLPTALLVNAFEKTKQQVFIDRLYDVIVQYPPPLLKILAKHQIWIQDAAFSPDSQYVVTVSLEGFGYLWNVATGEVERNFMLPDFSPLSYVQFSQDGQLLLIAGSSTALIFDMSQQKQIALLKGHSADILAAAFSNDNKYIVTGSQDNTARLWEVETGKTLQEYNGHEDLIYAVAIDTHNQLIATGSGDGSAKLWQLESGKLVHDFDQYQDAVKYLNFQNNALFVVSRNGQIQSWDIKTGEQLHNFVQEPTPLNYFALQADKMIATFENQTSEVWELNNPNPIAQFHHETPILRLDLFNNSVVTAAIDNQIAVWELGVEKLAYSITHLKEIRQVQLSPDGTKLLVISDETAYVYPFLDSQEAVLKVAEAMIENQTLPTEILQQFELE